MLINQEEKNVAKDILEQGFDLYTRYFLIARVADEVRTKTPMRILDAGGGAGLLGSFLKKDKIVVMDTLSSSPDCILGDITHAPFESQSFDLVISSDVYEHIQSAKRAEAISEMLRLSRNIVILGAPFYSPEVEEAEVIANNFWLKATGEPHRWLREHIENKLPYENELESILKERGYDFYKFGTNNLPTWLMLMLFSYYAQRYQIPQDKVGGVWHFYNENFADLGDFEEPTYRKIYLIGKRGTLPQVSLYKDSKVDRLKQHRLKSLVFDTILEATVEKVAHIANLEASLQQIQHSIPMQLVNRYQRIVEKLLHRGTRRRRYYELGLTSIRLILNEGWKSFFREVRAYLRGKRDRASKQP